MSAQTTWHHCGPTCQIPDPHCWSTAASCLGAHVTCEVQPAAPGPPFQPKGQSFPAQGRDAVPEQMPAQEQPLCPGEHSR
jgi:hypothetical protein